MYKTVSFYNFVDEFATMSRVQAFSHEGKKALFEYLEQLEDDIGESIELDVVALCCDFSEYESKKELLQEYDKESIEELEEYTIVFKTEKNSYIIQNF